MFVGGDVYLPHAFPMTCIYDFATMLPVCICVGKVLSSGGMISSSLSSFLKQYSTVAIYAALEVMHHLDMIQKMRQIWLNASATLLYMKTEHQSV